MNDYNIRTDCRLCWGPLAEVLRLADTPLANELSSSPDLDQDVFPLYLCRCSDCGHVQLPVVVDPGRLFRHYVYQSGTSPVFVRHLCDFARDVQPDPGGFVVEIGSNDGTLLAEYKRLGFEVVGVDPAENIADIAEQKNQVPTVRGFFGASTLDDPLLAGRRADLIIANNVFAHADDLSGILDGVSALLAPNGIFVFEVGYLCDVISRGLYRVVYHEHLSYHHIGPLRSFFRSRGLDLYDVGRVDTQGGSIRCFARPSGVSRALSPRMLQLAALETDDSTDVSRLVSVVEGDRASLRAKLDQARADGKVVCGYGSPAQLVTTCYSLGMTKDDVSFVVDDNPLKQGMYTPGLHWPIVPTSFLASASPDVCVIFSANFAQDIIGRNPGFKGDWVIP